MNKEIKLGNISQLGKYRKIVVIGPHRSGSTIASVIIADILKYKLINESDYFGNDPTEFVRMLMIPGNMVIHNTSFLRDIHLLNIECLVLVKRNKRAILESYKNSLKFGNESKGGIFASINDKAQEVILNHFCHKSGCIPDILYKHFKKHNKNYYIVNYVDLKSHPLFIKKRIRRKEFKHIKQTEVIWNNS